MDLADNRPFEFLTFDKIKKTIQMTIKDNHNTRKVELDHVVSELTQYNETLVELPQKDGKQLTYFEAWQERIKEQEYHKELGKLKGKEYDVRKNGILGYEILFTIPKDRGIDVETWKKRSVQWLHDTFDVAKDGKSNVLHAVYHGDEIGNHHIHAFVVPIDERGHLNASRFTDGWYKMVKQQNSYYDYVKDLGLKKGQAGSSAQHQNIRKLYSALNKAIQVDKPKEGELAEDYYKRVVKDIETYYAGLHKKLSDRTTREQRRLDEKKNEQLEVIQDELQKSRKIQNHERKEVKKEIDNLKQEIC